MIFEYCINSQATHAKPTKYLRWYLQIMERAAARAKPDPAEWHHVVPKSLGGSAGQVVALSFREHFLSHWLLTRIVEGEARRKMLFALGCLRRRSRVHERTLTGWQYERARLAWIAASVGRKLSAETRLRMSEAALRRGPEYSARMSASQSGRKLSEATKAKLSAFMRSLPPEVRDRMDAPRRGKSWGTHTAETRQRMSEAAYARSSDRKVSA